MPNIDIEYPIFIRTVVRTPHVSPQVLFKAALVILAGALGPAKVRKRAAGLCETLEVLRHPPDAILGEVSDFTRGRDTSPVCAILCPTIIVTGSTD